MRIRGIFCAMRVSVISAAGYLIIDDPNDDRSDPYRDR
jgi:hypothetical protein